MEKDATRTATRIPAFLADAPTQRLNVFALFILVQAYKLSQCFESSGEANSHNLLKWIAIDLLSVAIVATLRIPRLRFGWGGSMVIGASLIFVDWLLFGQVWVSRLHAAPYDAHGMLQVVASFLVPALVKSLFIRSISTRERSVRRSTVLGTEHLGGVHTVHLLPISTAQLNPSKRCYCRPTNSKSDKTLIPLIFNNTTPSRLSYSITTASASTVYDITINDLIPGSPKRDQLSLELDDWAPVPASPSPRHRSTSLAASDDLSPTQSLYFLPLSSIGTIKLLHVEDSDRRPVKLRQSRTDVIIAACPSAGFSTQGPTNRCQSAEPLSLDLAVSGHEPLSVRWHTTSSIRPGSVPSRLDGIIRGAEDLDSIIRLPVNVSLSDVGTQKFYLDSISDGCGNSVHYSTHSDQESFKGTSLEKTLAGMTDVRYVVALHSRRMRPLTFLLRTANSSYTLLLKFFSTAFVERDTTFDSCEERRASSNSRSTAWGTLASPRRRNSPLNCVSFPRRAAPSRRRSLSLAGRSRSTSSGRLRECKSNTLERTKFWASRANSAMELLSFQILCVSYCLSVRWRY